MTTSCHYKYYLTPAPQITPNYRDKAKGKEGKKKITVW